MEITLNKVKVGAMLTVSEEFIDNLQVTVGYPGTSWLENMIVLSFRSYLWGEDLGDVVIKYPENWWEAFKERWYPKYILDKFPVKYKTFRANQQVLYPELSLPSVPGERKIYKLKI